MAEFKKLVYESKFKKYAEVMSFPNATVEPLAPTKCNAARPSAPGVGRPLAEERTHGIY